MQREPPFDSPAWDELRRTWAAGLVDRPGLAPRYRCPCCRFPTLDGRCGFQICRLCWWEDEGLDDPYADQAWDGPNGGYSLAEARRNFASRLVMSAEDDGWVAKQLSPDALARKRALMRAYDAACEGGPGAPAAWRVVATAEDALETALFGFPLPLFEPDPDAPSA